MVELSEKNIDCKFKDKCTDFLTDRCKDCVNNNGVKSYYQAPKTDHWGYATWDP